MSLLMDRQRDLFEKRFGATCNLTRHEDGYGNPITNAYWTGWCACAATTNEDALEYRNIYCAAQEQAANAIWASMLIAGEPTYLQGNDVWRALKELVRLQDQYRPDPAPHEWANAWEAAAQALKAR